MPCLRKSSAGSRCPSMPPTLTFTTLRPPATHNQPRNNQGIEILSLNAPRLPPCLLPHPPHLPCSSLASLRPMIASGPTARTKCCPVTCKHSHLQSAASSLHRGLSCSCRGSEVGAVPACTWPPRTSCLRSRVAKSGTTLNARDTSPFVSVRVPAAKDDRQMASLC